MKGYAPKVASVLVAMCGCAAALVTGYHVEPVKAAWSGWTDTTSGHDYVSQVITCNFDELDSTAGAYCELFAGTEGGGGDYHVSVRTYPGDVEVGYGDRDGNVDHEWVRFNLHVYRPDSIVKGRKLASCFTRGGSDSVT